MNEEIKAKWLEALRSGRFLQGTGQLKYQNTMDGPFRHCCLGVLCEVLNVKSMPVPGEVSMISFEGNTSYLPFSVVERAGLLTGDPTIPVPSPDAPTTPLSDLNDNGKSFEEIAKLIEEFL